MINVFWLGGAKELDDRGPELRCAFLILRWSSRRTTSAAISAPYFELKVGVTLPYEGRYPEDRGTWKIDIRAIANSLRIIPGPCLLSHWALPRNRCRLSTRNGLNFSRPLHRGHSETKRSSSQASSGRQEQGDSNAVRFEFLAIPRIASMTS